MLLEEVIQEYLYDCRAKNFTEKTMKNKRLELKNFKIFIEEKRGITELESITPHDVRAYLRYKQNQGLQPQSVVSLYKMVRAFLNWCEYEEYVEVSPSKKIKPPIAKPKALKGFTANEVQNMIQSFSYKNYFEARNKAIIAMLSDTGLRSMELRGLCNENIMDESILVNGKGGKQRIVYISPALKKILIKYERIKKKHFEGKQVTDHYFLSYKGGAISNVGLDNVIKEAGKRADVEGKRVSAHTFRHFYAVSCLSGGLIDIYSLSRLLVHSDITVTQRYLHTMLAEQISGKAISSSPLMNLDK